jgi:hypothetical protein
MRMVDEAHEVAKLIKYLICGGQCITGSIIEFSGVFKLFRRGFSTHRVHTL